MVQSGEFKQMLTPLFRRIARCVLSPHFQVAERALSLWNNEYIVSLIAAHRAQVRARAPRTPYSLLPTAYFPPRTPYSLLPTAYFPPPAPYSLLPTAYFPPPAPYSLLPTANFLQVLPLVFEALYTNSRSHWNSTVHGLTCNVVKLFMEMDGPFFDKCSNGAFAHSSHIARTWDCSLFHS